MTSPPSLNYCFSLNFYEDEARKFAEVVRAEALGLFCLFVFLFRPI